MDIAVAEATVRATREQATADARDDLRELSRRAVEAGRDRSRRIIKTSRIDPRTGELRYNPAGRLLRDWYFHVYLNTLRRNLGEPAATIDAQQVEDTTSLLRRLRPHADSLDLPPRSRSGQEHRGRRRQPCCRRCHRSPGRRRRPPRCAARPRRPLRRRHPRSSHHPTLVPALLRRHHPRRHRHQASARSQHPRTRDGRSPGHRQRRRPPSHRTERCSASNRPTRRPSLPRSPHRSRSRGSGHDHVQPPTARRGILSCRPTSQRASNDQCRPRKPFPTHRQQQSRARGPARQDRLQGKRRGHRTNRIPAPRAGRCFNRRTRQPEPFAGIAAQHLLDTTTGPFTNTRSVSRAYRQSTVKHLPAQHWQALPGQDALKPLVKTHGRDFREFCTPSRLRCGPCPRSLRSLRAGPRCAQHHLENSMNSQPGRLCRD